MFRMFLVLLMMISINSAFSGERQFNIYNAKTGEKIDYAQFAKEALAFDLVFFGEFHDDVVIHNIQKDLLAEMYKQNSKVAVSMEMFERDVQKQVDDYLANRKDEKDFIATSRPWPDYEKFYKALVELAKANKAPVIAANVPRKYASIYSSQGMTGINKLPPEERQYISREVNVKEGPYMVNFYETMSGNMNMDSSEADDPNIQNSLFLFYGAQIVKDETMAESIVDFMNKNPEYKVIHFNGDFHSNSYLGTVMKVADRNSKLKMGIITPVYVETGANTDYDPQYKDKTDFLIVLQEQTKPIDLFAPQMMPGMHTPPNYVISHTIDIKLTPENHGIVGTNKVKMKNPVVKSARFKFLKDLKMKKITSPDAELEYEIKEPQGDDIYSYVTIKPKKTELNVIDFEYSGSVYYSPDVTLLNQRHSNTPGIISSKEGEGIYLPGGSYFPQTESDLADFDIKITVPKDMTIITSGTLAGKNVDGENAVFNYKSELPADDFILVGGRYVQKDTTVDGKKFSVFMFKDSPVANTYLTSAVKDYYTYTKLLGAYPYSGFAIVENFFATGFGMPGYTLLSNKLMAMPWVTLMPGSLPHEFVHNWWGNSVYVNYDMGNWCEALTTFCSNYYYNIANNIPDQALDWRKKAIISTNELPEEANYPVGKFEYQRNNNDATIGYQKGGFIFYEVMKLIGEKTFFNTMKKFSEKYKGKRATWFGLTNTFSTQCKADSINAPVAKVINQWLNSKNIPELTLDDVDYDDNKISFEINQDAKFYMSVPVVIDYGDSKEKKYFNIEAENNKFSADVKKEPKSITLDPEYECLRKLNKWEIPYSFSLTLTDKPLLILPSKKSSAYPIYEQVAGMMKESGYEIDFKSVDDLEDNDWEERSIIVAGDASTNSFFGKIMDKIPDNIKIKDSTFVVDDKSFNAIDNLMLLNYAHPEEDGKYMTLIYINNPANIDPFRRIFRYLSYSMLITNKTKAGRPQSQMELFPKAKDKEKLEYKF
jgi:aminopeptidase N